MQSGEYALLSPLSTFCIVLPAVWLICRRKTMPATHFIILHSTESTVQSVLNIYTLPAAKHTCTKFTYLWRNIWSKYWWPIRARGAWSRAGVEGGEVGVAKKVTNFRTFASNSFGWHQNVFSIYFTSPVAKKNRQQRERRLRSCSTGSYSLICKGMWWRKGWKETKVV